MAEAQAFRRAPALDTLAVQSVWLWRALELSGAREEKVSYVGCVDAGTQSQSSASKQRGCARRRGSCWRYLDSEFKVGSELCGNASCRTTVPEQRAQATRVRAEALQLLAPFLALPADMAQRVHAAVESIVSDLFPVFSQVGLLCLHGLLPAIMLHEENDTNTSRHIETFGGAKLGNIMKAFEGRQKAALML